MLQTSLSHYCITNINNPVCTLVIIALIILSTSNVYAKPVIQIVPNLDLRTSVNTISSENPSRKLLVFFDGTANDWRSRTNVRRLFEMVAVEENPFVISMHLDGVGSSSHPLIGGIFGFGMKERILDGYKFLARHRKTGDKILIFGFSRGAHQARALAGLMAYCGLYDATIDDSKLNKKAEQIWDRCRNVNEATDEEWKAWKTEDGPLLSKKLKLDTKVAEVDFLGIWDTVPGSQFKKFEDYGEAEDVKEGIRYKSQPYPTIHTIAHALARDEKRSKFRPIFVKAPIDPSRTTLHQVWFPGAHADVGGGYEDSNDLAGISLNWMVGLLKDQGIFHGTPPTVYSDPAGLAHWSLGDAPANTGSHYEDRHIDLVTLVAKEDTSVAEREKISKERGGVLIRSCQNKEKKKKITLELYPIVTEHCK